LEKNAKAVRITVLVLFIPKCFIAICVAGTQ
jgi:hypothetical protein